MRGCQALFLTPTRDIARQIQKAVASLSEYIKVDCTMCTGNTPVVRGEDKSGNHVVVGTPGRVYSMMNPRAAGAIASSDIQQVILHSADSMLERGFKEQIVDVIGLLPTHSKAQFILLAEKLPAEVAEVGRVDVSRGAGASCCTIVASACPVS